MKFSIYEFSQSEIVKFNMKHPKHSLDVEDLLIFQWFKDFAFLSETPTFDGKKRKGMWSKEENGFKYYYVSYKALIEEFPIFSYTSERSIQRRFAKYVETGILQKKLFRFGRKGTFAFYGFTSVFASFLYDKKDETQKLNPLQTCNEEEKQEIENENNQKNTVIDTNITVVKDGKEEKSIEIIPVTHDKPVQCNEIKTPTHDKPVQCNRLTHDKPVQCLYIDPTTNLNPTTTSSSLLENPSKQSNFEKSEVAVFLKNKVDSLFGFPTHFTPDPYPVLIKNLHFCEIEPKHYAEYISWVYLLLQKTVKDVTSFSGYFYKSFTQIPLIQKFKNELCKKLEKEKEEKENTIFCPVCNTKHFKTFDCEVCSFPSKYLENETEINKHKKIWNLPGRENYLKEREMVLLEYLKLGAGALTNKEIKQEMENKLDEINSKYGITSYVGKEGA